MLIDTYGRVATDLLTDDEVVRLVRIAVTRLGVEEVRFTGGEPLLRPGLVGIVERCAALAPRPRLSLTTNGIGPERTAEALERAGLDRVNVSLDTLRPTVFKALTRRDRHHDVLQGLAAARAAWLTPVKVNAVLMRGMNDDEAPRTDAARRPARLAARRHGHRRGHPGKPEHPLQAHPRAGRGPRVRARRTPARRRRLGPGRRHRRNAPGRSDSSRANRQVRAWPSAVSRVRSQARQKGRVTDARARGGERRPPTELGVRPWDGSPSDGAWCASGTAR
ncbi:hypothetical protein SSP24_76410 [Streptomyces spinoverrucosus]|uniref:Radical SAM core domain-containing protein n=1 Tax=Streptomyces spinoverrucosus TaxID=284043 RepID=A0A4Y3VY71_9ACTN|nr:hypothetical protein SSP24_76410 [Streptomyces spinoverrucosus]GHB51626.1 hypothetical protein GCM10010397_22420 [Streptomyces spinoverrucosus]